MRSFKGLKNAIASANRRLRKTWTRQDATTLDVIRIQSEQITNLANAVVMLADSFDELAETMEDIRSNVRKMSEWHAYEMTPGYRWD
jgi:uncharacterized protein YukE